MTRLAPSPTGALHLGNARTFLINWLMARQRGWRIVLRMEDLDGPRVKAGADGEAMEDLRWLGLDWDEGPIHQSGRTAEYGRAMVRLLEGKQAYACVCSRRDVELAASAPHAAEGAGVYPGTCRGRYGSVAEAEEQSGRPAAVRFAVPPGEVAWRDEWRGPQACEVAGRLGDFVIVKSDGTAAYQLAVVVDDAAMGITDVVRGDDLLESTPRQILLYRALGMDALIPRYFHVPLIVGEDGRRLAKRHGDTRLSSYRSQGVTAQRVLRMLGHWCGVDAEVEGVAELLALFRPERLSPRPIVFGAADAAYLECGEEPRAWGNKT